MPDVKVFLSGYAGKQLPACLDDDYEAWSVLKQMQCWWLIKTVQLIYIYIKFHWTPEQKGTKETYK